MIRNAPVGDIDRQIEPVAARDGLGIDLSACVVGRDARGDHTSVGRARSGHSAGPPSLAPVVVTNFPRVRNRAPDASRMTRSATLLAKFRAPDHAVCSRKSGSSRTKSVLLLGTCDDGKLAESVPGTESKGGPQHHADAIHAPQGLLHGSMLSCLA